jgi:hypothetical protein
MNDFPKDLRRVRCLFDMEAQTTVLATCPKCFAAYFPEKQGKILVYPPRCSHRAPYQQKPCGEQLTTQHVQDGESVRVPIQPFVMQDFDAFVATMLSRPGMEEILQKGTICEQRNQLFDIKDGNFLRTIPDADGQPFMRETKNGELRLAWSLCVDWFNPYLNKAAGKSASIGSIVMACLNLPPHLRYKPENLFLVGIMPKREPSREQINHILSPIVEKFLHSWQKGTWFTKTRLFPHGRLSRSIIALSVNDLLASKKVNGYGSHSADSFCSHCFTKLSDINNINSSEWSKRTHEHHIHWATKWRDAKSKKERKVIFRDHGVRWSELLRLPYWDPTTQVIVDGMHGLLLGIVQHHFRKILGIDRSKKTTKEPIQVDTKELAHARTVMSSKPSATKLQKVKVHVLRALCDEIGISTSSSGRNINKPQLISQLLARSSAITPTDGNRDHDVDGDVAMAAIPFGANEDFTSVFSEGFSAAHLSKADIKRLQSYIQATVRPSWHAPPPPNLGDPSHGKLTADQWRSCIEFDVPVALIQMASTGMWKGGQIPQEQIIHSTMLLAMAIGWATSHRTSEEHVKKYNEYMHAYLQSLLSMFPGMTLRPNHHNSLHLGSGLLNFGPIHGWWTFPFERLVGILQQVNTNSKMGERWFILENSSRLRTFKVNWRRPYWKLSVRPRTSKRSYSPKIAPMSSNKPDIFSTPAGVTNTVGP